jgi:hypothetical protein
MRRRESAWAGIVATIILWAVFIIGLGFMVHANWKLFMVGWNLWP